MAEETEKKPAPEIKPKGAGRVGAVVSVLLTALLSGAAAFGGARVAVVTVVHEEVKVEVPASEHQAPGATISLEPFLLTVPDSAGKPHGMKVTIALELKKDATAEKFAPFKPRVRDATLTYLRSLTFERASDSKLIEQAREELLERYHGIGAEDATQVLVTDFAIQ
jgi:flagellar basal body-associated protein FliL